MKGRGGEETKPRKGELQKKLGHVADVAFKTNSQQPHTRYHMYATHPQQNAGTTTDKIQHRTGPQIITGSIEWKTQYRKKNEEKVLLK